MTDGFDAQAETIPAELTLQEVTGLLSTVEGAIFSGQGGMDEGTLSAARKLLAIARERGIDLDAYSDTRRYSDFDETAAPGMG